MQVQLFHRDNSAKYDGIEIPEPWRRCYMTPEARIESIIICLQKQLVLKESKYNITPNNHYACYMGCGDYRECVKGELFEHD